MTLVHAWAPITQVECHFREIRVERADNRMAESLQIAKQIQADYSRFKAFVVVDRFEYMDYVSAGVSLLCKNLAKLVLFTGGTDALSEPHSFSARGLGQSLFIASRIS